MKKKKLNLAEDGRELFSYSDSTFLVDICQDDYCNFHNAQQDTHFHNEVEYIYILDGCIEYTINGAQYILRKGDCAFTNSNILHSSKSIGKTPAVTQMVLFPLTFLSDNLSGTIMQKYIQPIVGKDLLGTLIGHTDTGSAIISTIEDLADQDKDSFGYELCVSSLIYKLWKHTVTYLCEEDSLRFEGKTEYHNSEIAKNMLNYIHEHYASQIMIPDIANAICSSTGECFRCFKQFTGQTPVDYIQNYRLKQAEKLLINNKYSITEIGYQCGFYSSSYFSKLFKERFGMTPREYRKTYG